MFGICRSSGERRLQWMGVAALLIGSAVGAVWTVGQAFADGVDQPAPIQSADAEIRDFDLPAQPLTSALTAFGDQAGIQVTVDTALLAGLTSQPVRGRLTPEQALARLLAGTGIVWRFPDPTTVVLDKAVSDNTVLLDPLRVEGTNPSAVSGGYVAEQSTAGTKTDTPILETPQSISVVTADQMEAQGAQTVTDALRYTSGVDVQPFGLDERFDWLNIRGYDASAFLYRDGLGVPSNQIKLEPYGLERLEILKGPASVTYGQMAPGGIVNAVTKRPTVAPLHSIALTGGSFDHLEGRFDFGGPLDEEGQFLYRLTGLGRDSDTQVDHVPDNRIFIAPAFTWLPNEDTSLTLLADYRYDETRYPQGFPVIGTLQDNPNGQIDTDRFLGEPDQDKFNRTQYSLGLLFSHRLDDVFSVHQDFRYFHYDYELVAHNAIGFQAGQQRLVDRIVLISNPDFDGFTTDTRVEADFPTGPLDHKVLLGVNWLRSEVSNHGTIALSTPIDVYDPDYGNAGALPDDTRRNTDIQRQVGVYLQDQISLDDRWILTLSGRQDWAENASLNHVADTATEQESEDFTWRAGLIYLSEIGLAPYVSYATSFQPAIGATFDSTPFVPTTSEQYEVGVKYQPPGVKGTVTLSLFDLTQQNVLTADPDPLHPNSRVQTGETHTRGAELEAVASLAEGLDLIGSYTFLDTEITKSNNGDEGFRVMGIPHHAAALWADYTLQGGDFAGLGFGGGVRYVGPAWDNTNTLKTPDYVLFDAALHYDLGGISPLLEGARLSINASNLLDENYLAACAFETCYYGNRRTVMATLGYQW